MESGEINASIREGLRALAIGQHADFAPPAGEALRRFTMRVCGQAHIVFGKGGYRSGVVNGKIRVTRVAKPQAVAAPEPDTEVIPAVDEPDDKLLTREQAAAFLAPWFPQGITADQLRAFCNSGRGPAGVRNGRYVLHRVGDLREWVARRLQPAGQAAA